MILRIRNWCEGIIVAVIISIIIEMLVPDGKNKKYIKVVIGIYIMFVCFSPILELLNYDIKDINIFETKTLETAQTFNEYMKEMYIVGIEKSIYDEIKELGYEVENIKVYTDLGYENIEKVELKNVIKNGKDEIVKPVIIEKENNEKIEYSDIIKLLKEKYFLKEENIIFK